MRVFIGGYRGISPVSLGIKAVTWSPYSHVSIINGSGWTIESWHKGGVQHVTDPFTLHSQDTIVDLFRLNYPEEIHLGVWGSALRKVGMGYDFRALTGFIPGLRWVWKNDPDKWFCSHQVADDCLASGTYRLFNKTTPMYKMSPGFVLSSPWLVKLGSMQNMAEFMVRTNG